MVFSRLFTRCPLDDPREKAWVELGMQWLSEQFGIEPLLKAEVLLPTPEHFPLPCTGAPEDAERLLGRLCRQLHIEPAGIALEHFQDDRMPLSATGSAAAGVYSERDDGSAVISLARSTLADPLQLVATLAHELAHRRLLGENRIDPDVADHEQLTDLLPVFFGLGVFAANAVVRESSLEYGARHTWSIRRLGYLPARLFGYALALFAWLRGERRPAWAAPLRRDARTVLRQSLKYLDKTGDSLFTPATAGRPVDAPTVADLIAGLATGSDSRKIACLWELAEAGDGASAAVEAVLRLLQHRDPALRSTALETLADIGGPNAEAERAVLVMLRDGHPDVRASAATALAAVTTHRGEAVEELAAALSDGNAGVVQRAADALARFGPEARPAVESLLEPLQRALVRYNVGHARTYLQALDAIHPRVEDLLQANLRDPELYREAGEILREVQMLRRERQTSNIT